MTEVSVLAQTSLGDLRGVQLDGVVQFRGVPYAKPPVGDLRFAPPCSITPWTGVHEAREHGFMAPQPPSRLRDVVGDSSRPQNENCLTLTISTPDVDKKARPVVVFLHGGAYIAGAGSLDWYDGTTLAKEGDLVVVGVNYRLGALGFLFHPGVSKGMLGILDMIEALKWVRDHILDFGGDPDQVTVMGQSAGGHAILSMLAMPDVPNLFRRAILQSTPVGIPPFAETRALEYGNRLLASLNIPQEDAEDVAHQLKKQSTTRLIKAMGEVARSTSQFGKITPPFMPVLDSISTTDHFIEAAAKGAGAKGVDLIIGTTREEANAFLKVPLKQNLDPALVSKRFLELTGRADAIDLYRHRRPGGTMLDLLSDLVTDYIFLYPSLQFAEAATKAGVRTWVYQFDWAPANSPYRACHCIELPFVFGTLQAWNDAEMLRGADKEMMRNLSETIRFAWSTFAHTGDPKTERIAWPEYRLDGRQTMRFANTVGPVEDAAGIKWRV